MGKLSTYVLDITQGKPGVAVEIAHFTSCPRRRRSLLKNATTNQKRLARRAVSERRRNVGRLV